MPIDTIDFIVLEKEISETGKPHLDYLAEDMGKAYVVAITRDGCQACDTQKPKLNKLAKTMIEKHGRKVVFMNMHVRRPRGSDGESLRSKEVFGHYFYPTSLVLIRTADRGGIEFYRNVSPEMDELEKNIETAIEVAGMLEKEMS
jgi:hypothetical protein